MKNLKENYSREITEMSAKPKQAKFKNSVKKTFLILTSFF